MELILNINFKYIFNLIFQETYPLEYDMFAIPNVVLSIISPLLSALFAQWSPLEAPRLVLPAVVKWRELLNEEVYGALLVQHFVPAVAAAAE